MLGLFATCIRRIYSQLTTALLALMVLNIGLSIMIYLIHVQPFSEVYKGYFADPLTATAAVVILSYFVSTVLGGAITGLLDVHFHGIKNTIQHLLTTSVIAADYRRFTKLPKGALQSTYAKDSHVLAQYFAKDLMYALLHLIKIVATALLIFFLNPYALLLMAFIVGIAALLKAQITRKINATVPTMYGRYDDCSHVYTEAVNHNASIQLGNYGGFFRGKAERSHDRMTGIIGELYMLSFWQGLLGNVLGLVGLAILMYLLLAGAERSSLTATSIFSLFLVSRDFFNSSDAIINTVAQRKRIATSYQRVAEIADQRGQPAIQALAAGGRQGIIASDLSFAYDKAKRQIITPCSLALYAPGIVAIVGKSGSGKTTLLHLLSGLYSPTGGTVSYSGGDQGKAERSFIAQKPFIVRGTIRENLAFAGEGEQVKGDEDYWEALAQVNLKDELEQNGYTLDTNLDDHLGGLSVGQLQRLEIARSIIKGAAFVFLDEPTSALDKHSKHKSIEAITQIAATSLVVVSTHDPDLVAAAQHTIDMAADPALQSQSYA